jgi:hypothetical protein
VEPYSPGGGDMGVIWAIGGVLLSVLLAVVVAEARDYAGWVAPRIVGQAVKRLPEQLRATRQEEWVAEIAARDGLKIFRLTLAIGIYVSSVRVARAHRGRTAPRLVERAVDSATLGDAMNHALASFTRAIDTSNVVITADEIAQSMTRVGHLLHSPVVVAKALEAWPGDFTINYPMERGGPLTYTHVQFRQLAWANLQRGLLKVAPAP